jgi:uncharacterized membrane protein
MSTSVLLPILTSLGVGVSGGAVVLLAVLLANVTIASRQRPYLLGMVVWNRVALVASLLSLSPLIVAFRTFIADLPLVLLAIGSGMALFVFGMLAVRHRDIP